MQVQVETGMLCYYFPYACQPLIPFAYAHPNPGRQQANPGLQVQNSGAAAAASPESEPARGSRAATDSIVGPAAAPILPQGAPPVLSGIANLESAFYPLLVGAIALLVIFDYAS
jgi:hypothetical protein